MLMPLHGNRVLKCVLCSWECSHDLINSAEADEMKLPGAGTSL